MKKIAIAALLLVSGGAAAADILTCNYAKADISKGANAPMIPLGSTKVEFSGDSFKAFRPGGSYVSTPPLTTKKDGMLLLDDKTKVFAAMADKTSFAVSDRISKTTEQWEQCVIDTRAENQAKIDAEMKFIETMNASQGKKYFLSEKHAFTTNCLVWGDVTMVTGQHPAMLIAGSVNMGKNPKWNGSEYSFTFNNGSMVARFTPSELKHKLLIQSGDRFYGCGPSEIDRRFE